MSNLTILIVCSCIILLGWLVRQYQDRTGPFANIATKKPKSNLAQTKNQNTPKLSQIVKETFPDFIITEKNASKNQDRNCVFICQPLADDPNRLIELAIVKVVRGEKKHIKKMGNIISVTYHQLPSSRALKKDLSDIL